MNILSFNSRGLGSGVKCSTIRRMNLSNNVDILCIQETKKEVIDRKLCQYLWGDSSVTWEYVPSINAAGGLLCIWNNESFSVDRRTVGRGDVDFGILFPKGEADAELELVRYFDSE